MASVKLKCALLTAVLLVILGLIIAPKIRDYVFRQSNRKAVAQQIEREKSRVNLPNLTEADVLILAKTRIRSSDYLDYHQEPPFYVSRAQAWQISLIPRSNVKRLSSAIKPTNIWVDDTTRYVSRF